MGPRVESRAEPACLLGTEITHWQDAACSASIFLYSLSKPGPTGLLQPFLASRLPISLSEHPPPAVVFILGTERFIVSTHPSSLSWATGPLGQGVFLIITFWQPWAGISTHLAPRSPGPCTLAALQHLQPTK